jgi:hypothetical protein
MRWAVRRSVGVRLFRFIEEYGEKPPTSKADIHVPQAETKAFFDAVGERLESLHTDRDAEWLGTLELASRKCTSLKVLSVENYRRKKWGMTYVNALLDGCAQTLERLKLQYAEAEAKLGAFTLPKLRCLHLIRAPVQEGTLSQSLRHCPLLESFICTDLAQEDDCFDALALHCPLLKVLGVANINYETDALIRMLKACVNIEVVDLVPSKCCNIFSLSDAHVEAIVRYGANIRALRVCGVYVAGSVTVANSLIAVLQMRNLSRLVIESMRLPSDAALRELAASANFGANLQELEIHYLSGEFTATGLATLLRALPRLRKLSFDECDFVSDAFLRVLGAGSAVEVLRIAGCEFTEDSLVTLATGFPVLREMHIDSHMADVCSDAAQSLWCLLRPQLRIIVDHGGDYSGRGFPGFWEDLTDVTKAGCAPCW